MDSNSVPTEKCRCVPSSAIRGARCLPRYGSPVAWIFALWAQTDDAAAFAAHFDGATFTLADGTTTTCEAQVFGRAVWVVPSNVSRSGVRHDADAIQLTELGQHLYEQLRRAPRYEFALVGVEVDDQRSDGDVVELARGCYS